MSTSRPTTRMSPEQRHQELLAAAVGIGAADGLAAVTLARVAAAAGVSPALVHHYFSSAQELVNATFRHAADTDLHTARTRVAAVSNPAEQVKVLLDYVFDQDSVDAAALWVDTAAMARRSGSLASEADAVNADWLRFLADLVAAGTAAGDFHVTDPNVTARRLLTIIDGLGAQSATHTHTHNGNVADDDATQTPDSSPARSGSGALPVEDLKGIATDFAHHELGLN